MDVSKMKNLGYFPEITLEAGVKEMIGYYKAIKRGADQ